LGDEDDAAGPALWRKHISFGTIISSLILLCDVFFKVGHLHIKMMFLVISFFNAYLNACNK
jgi:hypothetical protein